MTDTAVLKKKCETSSEKDISEVEVEVEVDTSSVAVNLEWPRTS